MFLCSWRLLKTYLARVSQTHPQAFRSKVGLHEIGMLLLFLLMHNGWNLPAFNSKSLKVSGGHCMKDRFNSYNHLVISVSYQQNLTNKVANLFSLIYDLNRNELVQQIQLWSVKSFKSKALLHIRYITAFNVKMKSDGIFLFALILYCRPWSV